MVQLPSKLLSSSGSLPKVLAVLDEKGFQRVVSFFTDCLKTDKTRDVYSNAIGQFLAWCDNHELFLDHIGYEETVQYVQHLVSTKYSDNTISVHISSIRMLFDWLMTGYQLRANPVSLSHYWNLRQTNKPTRKIGTKTPAADDILRLLNSFGHRPIDLRDRAMIHLLFYNFATPQVISALHVEDVHEQDGIMWATFHRVDGTTYDAPLQKQARLALSDLLNSQGFITNQEGRTPIFRATRRGGALSGGQLVRVQTYSITTSRARQARCSVPITPSALRASGIIAYFLAGGSLQKAQLLSGIRTPNWAAVYAGESKLEGLELEGVFGNQGLATNPLSEYLSQIGLFKLSIN